MNKITIILLAGFLLIACNTKSREETKKNDSKENTSGTDKVKKTKNENSVSALDWYDIESNEPIVLGLPAELNEISGITFDDKGRLFAEEDENGNIFEIDPNSGKVLKKFHMGLIASLKGDFEDIAFVSGKFFMLKSNGNIFSFSEGKEGEYVEYTKIDIPLDKTNNVEGLCYDSETNSLLLACKDAPGVDEKKVRAVYSYSLATSQFDKQPRFLIHYDELKKESEESEFHPSGIVRHPANGNFLVIAAKGNIIVELTKSGEIVNYKNLPEKVHIQAEGIAVDKDLNLYISDEARNKTPVIVKYPKIK